MLNSNVTNATPVLVLLASLMLSPAGFAQQDKADKTGTNPINFTHDFRIYHEYSDLDTEGDGDQNVTTVEFRAPIVDGKWQWRVRGRYTGVKADFNNDGIDDFDDSGVGVVDMRFLTVPYLDMKKKRGLAFGVEVGLPTGDPGIGSQATTLGPQVFGVFFLPFGISNSIIAPAVQYKFDVDKEDGTADVEQILFDVFFLKTSADKKYWALINPQFVLDQENDTEFGFIDAEFGMMLGSSGQSVFVRPSMGIGGDKFTKWGVELGWKSIW